MLFKTTASGTHPAADRWLWCASLCLLVVFTCCHVSLALDRSPSGDDALFLSVPKNWLNGYGWATSYSEKIPFNPDFTGPTTLLWLAALLMLLFGTATWIAGITGLLTNLLLLSLCLWQIHRYWRNRGLAALALVCGMYASLPEDFSSLIGYYSGSLAFLLATLVACNPHDSLLRRSFLIGLLAAFSLLVKWLLAPAFCLLAMTSLLQHALQARQAATTALGRELLQAAVMMLVPVIVLCGSWQWYRLHTLAAYSAEYRAVHAAYGRDFFLHHGSGIAQWQGAADKIDYIVRNIDRNLYQLDNMLALHGIRNPLAASEPADSHHLCGILFLLLVTLLAGYHARRALANPAASIHWCGAILGSSVLFYAAWFLLFAMAMSPGHLYFPMQWALWSILLLTAGSLPERCGTTRCGITGQCLLAGMILLACTGGMMPADSRRTLLALDRSNVPRNDSQWQAAAFLQTQQLSAPLAGCGYGGYPRHLEYLLPGSQHFADCLDLVEDHVVQDDNGHYQWQTMPDFTLVFSLQSAGISPATARILRRCSDQVLYRNPEVLILVCRGRSLQTLDADALMTDIRKDHAWYRTRLMPWNGRRFPVLAR